MRSRCAGLDLGIFTRLAAGAATADSLGAARAARGSILVSEAGMSAGGGRSGPYADVALKSGNVEISDQDIDAHRP